MMKKIGLIGGTSAISTLDYYQIINETINLKLGGHNSAELVLNSLNFEKIAPLVLDDQWDLLYKIMLKACHDLEKLEVSYIALCSNTLHKLYYRLMEAIETPILHILDPTLEVIKKKDLKQVALLGTKKTTTDLFHINYIKEKSSARVLTPNKWFKNSLNEIIFEKICKNKVDDDDLYILEKTLDHVISMGAEATILACTELPKVFQKIKSPIQLIDTTALHSNWIAQKAMEA